MGSLGEMEKAQGDLSSIHSSQCASSLSDGEFWMDLDTKPTQALLPQGISQFTIDTAEQESTSKMTSFDLGVEVLRKQGRRLSHLDPTEPLAMHIERSVNRLRKVKNSELANSSAVLKNALARQFEAKIQNLNTQHVIARYNQEEYINHLKEEVLVKSAEITHLRRLLEEQEVLITDLRMMSSNNVDKLQGENPANGESYERKRGIMGGLMVEIDNAKTEIAMLSHNAEQYKVEAKERAKECSRLASRVKAVKQELYRERIQHEAEKSELQASFEQQCKDLQQTMVEVRRLAAIESRANEEIQLRLQGVIKELQEELRTAKMILASPKLRDKVLVRLKDARSLVETSPSVPRMTIQSSRQSPLSRNTAQTESRRRYRVSPMNDSEMSETMMVRAMSVSPHQQRLKRPL
jgi:hypothetical protein